MVVYKRQKDPRIRKILGVFFPKYECTLHQHPPSHTACFRRPAIKMCCAVKLCDALDTARPMLLHCSEAHDRPVLIFENCQSNIVVFLNGLNILEAKSAGELLFIPL